MTAVVNFPGSTAVSDLAVYDWLGPDGIRGGSPHLHTVSTEGYVVLEGVGELRTLTADGPGRYDLRPGVVLWFAPGTVHRLVNLGGLRILTVMQNAGLPEAGDAVLTFPRHVVADPDAYRLAADLPSSDEAEDVLADAALRRRDLALEGLAELESDYSARGAIALAEFHELAGRLVRPRVTDWRRLWSDSVESDTETTRTHLEALAAGRTDHLAEARVVVADRSLGPKPFGMCGRLGTWKPPA